MVNTWLSKATGLLVASEERFNFVENCLNGQKLIDKKLFPN
jgi:hypothetical protein